jgi:hypothetical protein
MTKIGHMRSSVESAFSRTSRRDQSVRRFLLSRVAGKPGRESPALTPERLARSVRSEIGLSLAVATTLRRFCLNE